MWWHQSRRKCHVLDVTFNNLLRVRFFKQQWSFFLKKSRQAETNVYLLEAISYTAYILQLEFWAKSSFVQICKILLVIYLSAIFSPYCFWETCTDDQCRTGQPLKKLSFGPPAAWTRLLMASEATTLIHPKLLPKSDNPWSLGCREPVWKCERRVEKTRI